MASWCRRLVSARLAVALTLVGARLSVVLSANVDNMRPISPEFRRRLKLSPC